MRPEVLLKLVIFAWAASWPAIKVGVSGMPPLWYACLRYAIAAACLFAFLGARRRIARPPRADWPLVVGSAVLQMAAYSGLTAAALTILPPGRASVLAFSTPLWVVPLAAWRLDEPVSRPAWLGVGLGLAGALAIAAPALGADAARELVAYSMLLGAAAAWALAIVLVRVHRFQASPLVLAPWQMALAACLLLPLAVLLEGVPAALPPPRSAASLAYVGPVATAFAYWAVVEAGRHLKASQLSTALLATPALGALISAFTLGEEIGLSLVAGAVLIAAGIRLAVPPSA